MSEQSWLQWQQLAAVWMPGFGAPGSNSGARPAGGSFGPFEQLAERFKHATEQLISSIAADPAQSSHATQAFSDFLREQLSVPFWSPAGVGPATAPPPFAPADWQALGPAREQQQSWQRMSEAASRVAQAQARMQSLWSDSMKQAASAFASELSARPADSANAPGWREVYDRWIDQAEQRYAQLAREPDFCEAQTELINAGSAWRHEARNHVEQCCKWLDLPTRAEFNTVIRKLKSLEQTLHAASAATGNRPTSE